MPTRRDFVSTMRRMRRWTSNVLCATSLLIFLLAMGIWVRSYIGGDIIWCRTELPIYDRYTQIVSFQGELHFNQYPDLGSKRGSTGWQLDRTSVPFFSLPVSYVPIVNRFGFAVYRDGYFTEATLPLWLFGLFAIPPVLWVRRWRRERGRGFPVELAVAERTGAENRESKRCASC